MTRDRDRTWPQCERAGCTSEASQPVGEPKLCIAHAFELDRKLILCDRCREMSTRRHARIQLGAQTFFVCEICSPIVEAMLRTLEPPMEKPKRRCEDCGQPANSTLVWAASDEDEHTHHYCALHILTHVAGRNWELRT